jgi:hypothetical protein
MAVLTDEKVGRNEMFHQVGGEGKCENREERKGSGEGS